MIAVHVGVTWRIHDARRIEFALTASPPQSCHIFNRRSSDEHDATAVTHDVTKPEASKMLSASRQKI
jgi:hypothetical protein